MNIDDFNAHIGFVGLFCYCENRDDSIVSGIFSFVKY